MASRWGVYSKSTAEPEEKEKQRDADAIKRRTNENLTSETPTKTTKDHPEKKQTDNEEFDFCVYVRNDGFLFRVGNLCFVDSFSCFVNSDF